MKIGIMGGTFDPIHNGHMMLAQYAYQMQHLDEVWFLPNGHPPHKSERTIETGIPDRMDMLRGAIEGTSYFKISSYEVDRTQISYSYETMEHFKAVYPQHTFYFIVGADSLFSIESWRHPDRLLKVCHILAAYRDDIDTDEEMMTQIQFLRKKYHAKIAILKTPLYEVSSSEIRMMIKEGRDVSGLVPRNVKKYIAEHHLYEECEL